ncbi:MAG: triose-phosphate isomerase [Candidatus Pelagibacter sp. TMED64]|nr:triose-phosphate isomerase [Candidatus Pelagibacter sp.]OUU67439.1 MAG: triose-phosphate isomerase [Candidatus Pelagibacter sp. TMED64]|tara:strand:+ start:1000 stop:1767 length:768 start_codon:yes stop_codon:yes gene_type:complete
MTNKFKYFIANWKMYGDLSSFQIIKSVNAYLKIEKYKKNPKKIIFCLPNTLIHPFAKKVKNRKIYVGAQDCHYLEKQGSFTGSVSPYMLKKVGAKYVIIGHSENRKINDNYKILKNKILAASNQNLKIIFCIGESKKEKLNNKTFHVLKKQIINSISKGTNLKNIIFAYEPIWSIGGNKIPEIKSLNNITVFIKNFVKKNYKVSFYPKVVYGGAVDSKKMSLLQKVSKIDGFLIGRASQSSNNFIAILKNYYKQS